MSCFAGPETSTDGLVFAYDMNNTSNSWKGAPTVNLLYDSQTLNSTFANLVATATVTNLTINKLRITTGNTSGSLRVNVPLTKLTNNQQYTMSYKYRFVSGGPTLSMTDFCDTALINNTSTVYDDYIDSSATTATGLTFDATYRFMDFTVSGNSVIDLWDFQLENKTYRTPFTNGTRSNTNSIIDITNNHTITANGITYASDNTFSWPGGVSASLSTPSSSLFAFGTGDFTLECWIYPQSFGTYTHMIAFPTQNTAALKAALTTGSIYYYSPSFRTDPTISGWTLTLNQWNHVVFSRASSIAYAFLNGNFIGSKSGFSSSLSSQQLFVGNGATNEYTAKKIPVVRIYNRALLQEEISRNFNSLRGRFGI